MERNFNFNYLLELFQNFQPLQFLTVFYLFLKIQYLKEIFPVPLRKIQIIISILLKVEIKENFLVLIQSVLLFHQIQHY